MAIPVFKPKTIKEIYGTRAELAAFLLPDQFGITTDTNEYIWKDHAGNVHVNVQGMTGIQGQTGVAGVTGIYGATGIQGVTGIYGETGIQGVTGIYGETGIQGVTGIYGETGIQGVTGIYGETGIQGVTGIYGETGIQGVTGIYGETGIRGVTGIYGETGIQGVTGIYGQTGIQGVTGIYGETGVQGVTGIYGETGIQGNTGLQGFTGVGVTGLQGQTGIQGPLGNSDWTSGAVGIHYPGPIAVNTSLDPSSQMDVTGNAIITGTLNDTKIGKAAYNNFYFSSVAFPNNVNGNDNIAIGLNSLVNKQTGEGSIAIGRNTLDADLSGAYNIAIGDYALTALNTGSSNISLGRDSLTSLVSGDNNIAVGKNTGQFMSGGSDNIIMGYRALWSGTTTSNNVAIGYYTLYSDTTGANNIAIGYNAMSVKTGDHNIGIGVNALEYGPGDRNTAIGGNALLWVNGNQNIGIGYMAGQAIYSGNYNVVIGSNTGSTIDALSNCIIISDGQGNIRQYTDNNGLMTNYGNITLDTTNSSTVGPYADFNNDNGTAGANNDLPGIVRFKSNDTGGFLREFARITAKVKSANSGTPLGQIDIEVANGSSTDSSTSPALTIISSNSGTGAQITTDSTGIKYQTQDGDLYIDPASPHKTYITSDASVIGSTVQMSKDALMSLNIFRETTNLYSTDIGSLNFDGYDTTTGSPNTYSRITFNKINSTLISCSSDKKSSELSFNVYSYGTGIKALDIIGSYFYDGGPTEAKIITPLNLYVETNKRVACGGGVTSGNTGTNTGTVSLYIDGTSYDLMYM